MDQITVYGAPWCPDTRRSQAFLAEQRVPYRWLDIDQDAEARRFVEEIQRGGRTIPTIVFPDGSHLLEPSSADLAAKLGVGMPSSARGAGRPADHGASPPDNRSGGPDDPGDAVDALVPLGGRPRG